MHRRTFLQTAGTLARAAVLVSPLLPQARAATNKPQKFLAGFAPATDGSLESFWRNMEACAKVGFHTIEVDNSRLKLAQAYASRVNEFKDRMAALSLRLVGLNEVYPLLEPAKYPDIRRENEIIGKFLQAIGAIYTGPYGALSEDEEGMRALARFANEEGRRSREKYGIRFAYHTHSSVGFRRLMDLTKPGDVWLTIDLGWVGLRGGSDAVQVVKAYRSRLMTLHYKDYDPNYEFDYQGQHHKGGIVIPGKGVIDFAAVTEFLKESDFDGCVLGEHIGLGTYDFVRSKESVTAYPAFKAYFDKLGLKL